MNELAYFANKSIYLIMVFSAIPILVATVVGILVALLQTVTQIQEQTLPFGLKLLATSLTILLISGWISRTIMSFYDEIFFMILGI